MKFIYAFGSICRGELDIYSDIDLLLVTDDKGKTNEDLLLKFSVYNFKTLRDLWLEGNPFAWHLHKEARLIFSLDGNDVIKEMGTPNDYKNGVKDCQKFYAIFLDAVDSINDGMETKVFDLGTIFLAIRNFATCFGVHHLNVHSFSRRSALQIGDYSLKIEHDNYLLLERARVLSTRGKGEALTVTEIKKVETNLGAINAWFLKLLKLM